VTDRCNLDFAYCIEYDNSWPHPSLDDLKKWIREIVARAKRACPRCYLLLQARGMLELRRKKAAFIDIESIY